MLPNFTGIAQISCSGDIVAAQEIARIDRLDLQQHFLAVAQHRGAAGDDPGQEADLGERQHRAEITSLFPFIMLLAPTGVRSFMRFSMRMMTRARRPAQRRQRGRGRPCRASC